MRPVQRFSEEYLRSCRDMTPDHVIRFLEDFRRVHACRPARSKLISMRVPEDLLAAFRAQASLEGTPYQTKIKDLMRAWLTGAGSSRREAAAPTEDSARILPTRP